MPLEKSSTLAAKPTPPKMAESFVPPPAKQPKVVVKGQDMPDEMRVAAIEVAVMALDRCELERDMAMFLKQEFDKRYQPTWHCIVGRHFGSYVSHETSGFIYFYIDKLAVLLFKSGDAA